MRRVLLVEHRLEAVHAARAVLERLGVEVAIALDGTTAVELLHQHRVDCVLAATELLAAPGPDLVGRLREAAPGLPVLTIGPEGMLSRPLTAPALAQALAAARGETAGA